MIFEIIQQNIIYILLRFERILRYSEILDKRIKLQKVILKACYGSVEAQYSVAMQWMVWDYRNPEKIGGGKEVRQAIKWFKRAAEQGHARSRYELGNIYLSGKGKVIADERTAYEWMRKAAYQKDDKAEFQLARMYQNGWGTELNYVRAREWFETASMSGNYEAQGELATMYKEGIGGGRNIEQARYWKKQFKLGQATRNTCGHYPHIDTMGVM